jgi:transcriptional regulator with XRE-family HTH domain
VPAGRDLKSELVRLRCAAGLYQTDIARMLGVSKTTVQNWERGLCKPSARLVPKYAYVLGITPNRLMDILAEMHEQKAAV